MVVDAAAAVNWASGLVVVEGLTVVVGVCAARAGVLPKAAGVVVPVTGAATATGAFVTAVGAWLVGAVGMPLAGAKAVVGVVSLKLDVVVGGVGVCWMVSELASG